MSEEPGLSPRAQQIIDGLLRTGRGLKPRLRGGYVKLDAVSSGGFYFVACDGGSLRRGTTLTDAEELQAKFADAMARAGQPVSWRPR